MYDIDLMELEFKVILLVSSINGFFFYFIYLKYEYLLIIFIESLEYNATAPIEAGIHTLSWHPR
jgi:hypothetical protein